jgi:molybdopterin molybdotransferase
MYKEPKHEPSRDEMYELLKMHVEPIERIRVLPVSQANRRISSESIYSVNVLPNSPVSTFDGISVRFEHFLNGMPDTYTWKEGVEYQFSNTGVAIEEGYDTVIAIEDVRFDKEGRITIQTRPQKKGENIGSAGSQIKEEELIVHKGEEITPSLIGILYSAGITTISVYDKPIVTFIPTGDELVPSGYALPKGKNVESNSKMLEAYINEWGGSVISYPVIQDDCEQLKICLKKAIATSDLVIICAGSSKGSKDYTIHILEELGEVIVQELGHGPGKHCSLAKIVGKPVIGLPGPPIGAELTAKLYVQAAIALLQRKPLPVPETLEVIAEQDINGLGIDFIGHIYIYKRDGSFYGRLLNLRGNTRSVNYHGYNAYLYIKKGSVFLKGSKIEVELQCDRRYLREKQL